MTVLTPQVVESGLEHFRPPPPPPPENKVQELQPFKVTYPSAIGFIMAVVRDPLVILFVVAVLTLLAAANAMIWGVRATAVVGTLAACVVVVVATGIGTPRVTATTVAPTAAAMAAPAAVAATGPITAAADRALIWPPASLTPTTIVTDTALATRSAPVVIVPVRAAVVVGAGMPAAGLLRWWPRSVPAPLIRHRAVILVVTSRGLVEPPLGRNLLAIPRVPWVGRSAVLLVPLWVIPRAPVEPLVGAVAVIRVIPPMPIGTLLHIVHLRGVIHEGGGGLAVPLVVLGFSLRGVGPGVGLGVGGGELWLVEGLGPGVLADAVVRVLLVAVPRGQAGFRGLGCRRAFVLRREVRGVIDRTSRNAQRCRL